MIALSLGALLTYSFPLGFKQEFELTVDLDGYLPVLGRTQNKARVEMTIALHGKTPESDPEPKAVYEVTAMRASLGGVGLPFTAENVKAYFPKANLILAASGRVLKSDAPATSLPIRLPGLDSRRLPEISFLPLEFPADPVEPGKSWSFRRKFGEGEIEFTATPALIDDGIAVFEVKLASRSLEFEDVSGGPAKAEKGAASQILTELNGTGRVVFNRKLGMPENWTAEYTARSTVTDLKTKAPSERVLKTKVAVRRVGSGA